jgi:hypothetical protein
VSFGDDAKGALKKITRGAHHTVTDQVRFVNKMDLDLCRERCPSLAKLLRDVAKLVNEIDERISSGHSRA